ncbi:MAG: hypothetical protein HN952_06165 [Candidatus Cloacimonetes bacterium]|jgi:hypothetical protein|nr:hypothetical protein [Candidatus Cloacimonadota bacterium]
MSKWLLLIAKALPKREIKNFIIGILRNWVKETDNTIDDQAVEIINVMLDAALINE